MTHAGLALVKPLWFAISGGAEAKPLYRLGLILAKAIGGLPVGILVAVSAMIGTNTIFAYFGAELFRVARKAPIFWCTENTAFSLTFFSLLLLASGFLAFRFFRARTFRETAGLTILGLCLFELAFTLQGATILTGPLWDTAVAVENFCYAIGSTP